MRSILISGLFVITVAAAHAGETKRDLGAHEHGVGKLNIAFEVGQIALELEAPGADIVGFEHHAESTDDRRKVDEAISILAKPLEMFKLSEDAGCQVSAAKVELQGDNEGVHEEHHAHEEEHAEEDHHAEDEHHAEAHGEEEGGHTEFHAQFVLTCANPDAVTQIDFAYFSIFPNAQELEVRMISDSGATSLEVTRDNPRLDLSGMI